MEAAVPSTIKELQRGGPCACLGQQQLQQRPQWQQQPQQQRSFRRNNPGYAKILNHEIV